MTSVSFSHKWGSPNQASWIVMFHSVSSLQRWVLWTGALPGLFHFLLGRTKTVEMYVTDPKMALKNPTNHLHIPKYKTQGPSGNQDYESLILAWMPWHLAPPTPCPLEPMLHFLYCWPWTNSDSPFLWPFLWETKYFWRNHKALLSGLHTTCVLLPLPGLQCSSATWLALLLSPAPSCPHCCCEAILEAVSVVQMHMPMWQQRGNCRSGGRCP